MIFAAVLAGGTGSRMRLDTMPKQFLPLGGKPVFLHTLEKFLLVPDFERVMLGIHPDWAGQARAIVEEAGIADRVDLVPGGADRNSTLFNVLDRIEENYGAGDHHVVTHDAVRPFVTVKIIEANIAAVQEYGACDTVTPATDTIVSAPDGEFIDTVPNRAHLYQGQTPQSFKISLLREAFETLTDKQKAELTDACKAVSLAGKPVKLVEGADTNIKLTTVMDYNVAQALLHRIESHD